MGLFPETHQDHPLAVDQLDYEPPVYEIGKRGDCLSRPIVVARHFALTSILDGMQRKSTVYYRLSVKLPVI